MVIKKNHSIFKVGPAINLSVLTLATGLLVTRIYHLVKHPPPFGFEWLHRVGLMTLVCTWLVTTKPYWVYFRWYDNSDCDFHVRFNTTHYALVHSFLLWFCVIRLDITRGPVSFWWDRVRKTYLALKYSFLLVGVLNPVAIFILIRGKATKVEGQDFYVCSYDYSSLEFGSPTGSILLSGMLIQQLIYIAVLVLFIRPISKMLQILESKKLQQILAQTSFWNSAIIIVELLLLVCSGVLINFLPRDTDKKEALARIGDLDCLLVMLCVVMCLRPPAPDTPPCSPTAAPGTKHQTKWRWPHYSTSTRSSSSETKRPNSRSGDFHPSAVASADFDFYEAKDSRSRNNYPSYPTTSTLPVVPEKRSLSDLKTGEKQSWKPSISTELKRKAKDKSLGYNRVQDLLDVMFTDLPNNFTVPEGPANMFQLLDDLPNNFNLAHVPRQPAPPVESDEEKQDLPPTTTCPAPLRPRSSEETQTDAKERARAQIELEAFLNASSGSEENPKSPGTRVSEDLFPTKEDLFQAARNQFPGLELPELDYEILMKQIKLKCEELQLHPTPLLVVRCLEVILGGTTDFFPARTEETKSTGPEGFLRGPGQSSAKEGFRFSNS